jgi:Na+/proline symporter
MKLLPNGLIGVFIAAMLAATMSTLSSVYNMVSSILSRDIYQGWIRPQTTDEGLLNVGRFFSVGLGLFVTGLAVLFNNTTFGIFNLMQEFFTLLNIPVVVPVAFGLLFQRLPKGSAIAAIVWGLLAGVTTRFLLGWDVGPKVYLAFTVSFSIFVTSYWLGQTYLKRKGLLAALCVITTLILGGLFASTFAFEPLWWERLLGWGSAAVMGVSLWFFSRLFSAETEAERAAVDAFFERLATPIDVAREVFGAGKKQISTFPLVGGTTVIMGLLMCLVFFTEMAPSERIALAVIIVIMITFGILMWYFGRRSEIRSAADFEKKTHH